MIKIEVNIAALSHSVTSSHNYAVVLSELEGQRRLPIIIGGYEAQAIAVAMEKMAPNRPLTHDLFKNTMDSFDIELKEVIINNLVDGIFYAKLICLRHGDVYEIDSRTSDAIAMAVRYNCPIFTYEFILEEAGVVLEEKIEDKKPSQSSNPRPTKSKTIADMNDEDLEELLNKVLAKEDYEKAAKIRDELNKRQQK